MKRHFLTILVVFCAFTAVKAQINTDRMMAIGRNALYFEDYVLSIQYFNQVINIKPYLAEPYLYRGIAKLYLDDYVGAEEDCSYALDRNGFLARAYVCRSYARIKLGKFNDAVADCDRGLEFDTQNKTLLTNKGLALVAAKRYTEAEICLDDIIRRYPNDVGLYMEKGQMNLERGDTLAAVDNFSRAVSIDKYFAKAWGARGWVFLMKGKFSNALADLNEAVRLQQNEAGFYINRALVRYNMNDLRGTMEDFDQFISLEPNSKLGYLNRAILRTNVGDLNRALEDFDKAIYLEPTDFQTIYNRGLVLKDLGKNKEALADFTTIINRYPQFTPAYYQRSDLKKRLGDAKGADRDYFAAFNIEEKAKEAKLAKKLNKKTVDAIKEDEATDTLGLIKYNRMIAVATKNDELDTYSNPMRGKVQDRAVEIELQPLFKLTYNLTAQPGPTRKMLDIRKYLGTITLGAKKDGQKPIISNSEISMTAEQADKHFASIDNYSKLIGDNPSVPDYFFARCLDFAMVQDLTSAMRDLDRTIELNNRYVLAYFERANLRYLQMNADYASKEDAKDLLNSKQNSSQPVGLIAGSLNLGEKVFGADLDMVIRDFQKVVELDPTFYYAYYNRGIIRCQQRDYRSALLDFTKAIEVNAEFSDAWFNRGITQIFLGDREHGMADLRMAGQLGNYKAYSILKRLGD